MRNIPRAHKSIRRARVWGCATLLLSSAPLSDSYSTEAMQLKPGWNTSPRTISAVLFIKSGATFTSARRRTRCEVTRIVHRFRAHPQHSRISRDFLSPVSSSGYISDCSGFALHSEASRRRSLPEHATVALSTTPCFRVLSEDTPSRREFTASSWGG